MNSGGYSNRVQQFNTNHAEHIKHIHQTERMDMIARSKKLQQETNRRRKALAIKRKLESQREEKRRQEILNKRREEQQRATEKYQRLNKHYTPSEKDDEPPSEQGPFSPPPESPRSTPGLEDALRAVRGPSTRRGTPEGFNRQGSAESLKSGSTSSKPARVGSAGSTGGGSSISSASHGPPPGTFYGSDALNRAYYNKYGAGSTTLNARTAEHARQIAVHTELHSTSLRNLNNSRSLFEAQLEHHQHQLADHQRQALNQFNAAIRKEIDSDATLQGTEDIEPELVRSNSVSSVDSLEDEHFSDRANTPIKSSSETQLASNPQDNNSAFPKAGQYNQSNFLHSSQSDSCLQKYGQSQPLVEHDQLSKHYNESPDYEMRQTSGLNAVNSGTSAGFSLHRSHSSNSNVAVVQPLSNVNQNHNFASNNQAKKPVASIQSRVTHNTQSPPVTNGYFTQSPGDSGKNPGVITAQSPGAVPGKDLNVIGPISASNMGRNGNQYHVDQLANTQVPNSKSFYLGSHSGNHYTVASVVSSPDKKTLNDDDFHARTKAWTTPTPDILSPLGEANQGHGSRGLDNFTTNVKPNSTRLTATNTTLTTASPSGPQVYPNTNTVQPGSAAGGYGAQHQSGITAPGSHAYTTAQNVHQNGVVYSKSSIPSTAIVTSNMAYNHQIASVPMEPDTPTSTTGTATTIIEERSAREEDSANESCEEEVQEKVVKGILKQTFNVNQPYGTGRGRGVRGKGYVGIHFARGRGRGHTMGAETTGARDSIEVAKEHRGEDEKPEKKSVRFAEKLVEEQGETIVEYREPESTFVKPTIKENVAKVTKKSTKIKGRPPRPVSAKVTSTAPKATGVRESRVASAGTLRRGPFIRQNAKVTVSKQPPNENGVKFRSGSSATPITNNTINTGSATTGNNQNNAVRSNPTQGPVKSNLEPVYDGNGLRLDRTPTDDEINWLWDKVRTCLSRNSTVSSHDTQSQTTDQSSVTGRQTAAISSKYIDGNSLAPQFRAATRVNQNGNSMANEREVTINGTGNYHGAARKKISMDHLNSYSRKTSGLLSHRKNSAQAQAAQPSTVTMTHTTTYQPPTHSTQGPQNGEVSESMAAFLTAENLAQQSVSESHIEDAMEAAKHNQRLHNTSKPQHKVPTALSIEEQRLLQSLERLNERLKSHVQKSRPTSVFTSSSSLRGTKRHAENREVYVYQNWTEGNQTKSGYRLTETSVAGGASNYAPRMAQYGRGFRGHQPLTASQRRYNSATQATAENRQLFRATSAGNIHSNFGGHIAYH